MKICSDSVWCPTFLLLRAKKTAKENDVMLAFYQMTWNVLHISVSKFCTKQLNVKKSLLKDFTTAEQHIFLYFCLNMSSKLKIQARSILHLCSQSLCSSLLYTWNCTTVKKVSKFMHCLGIGYATSSWIILF